MLATLALELPEIVQKLSAFLRDASPVVFIVIGAVLFLFAGAIKWLIKLIGAGMLIYGLLAALQLL